MQYNTIYVQTTKEKPQHPYFGAGNKTTNTRVLLDILHPVVS